MLKKFDKDGDGKLSDSERKALMEHVRKHHQGERRGPKGAGKGPEGRGEGKGKKPEGKPKRPAKE